MADWIVSALALAQVCCTSVTGWGVPDGLCPETCKHTMGENILHAWAMMQALLHDSRMLEGRVYAIQQCTPSRPP